MASNSTENSIESPFTWSRPAVSTVAFVILYRFLEFVIMPYFILQYMDGFEVANNITMSDKSFVFAIVMTANGFMGLTTTAALVIQIVFLISSISLLKVMLLQG